MMILDAAPPSVSNEILGNELVVSIIIVTLIVFTIVVMIVSNKKEGKSNEKNN